MSLPQRQNMICLFVIALVTAIIYIVVPKPSYVPHGMASIWQANLSPVATDNVQVRSTPQYFTSAQIIGEVRAELATAADDTDPMRHLLKYAQTLTGNMGANTLVVTGVGSQSKVIMIEGLALKE